jgi:putative ABC transport system ATP-binding protein
MIDLVCGMELEKETEFRHEVKGARYFFCSSNCLGEFAEDPEKFLQVEPLILLENVYKNYNLGDVSVPVLRGLSMRIYSGDLVALVGPSGSGKSTAMNIIGTLDAPTSGNVRILGKDVAGMSESELADLRSKNIGFVFQQFNLVPSLTALENVMLPRLIRGDAGSATRQRAVELLESVGLAARIDHRPMELSGGEQQRVAIARAFMNDPEIILADEPTGNLDSTTSAKIIDLLVDLWQKFKKTIIIVTHDPHVASHSHRILNFQDGKLVRNHGLAERAIWHEKKHHNGV